MAREPIPVLVPTDEHGERRQALHDYTPAHLGHKVSEVGAEVLASNFRSFLASFRDVLRDTDHSYEGFRLEEIELSLAVDASGKVSLVGEIGSGIQTSMVVRFRREDSDG